MPLPFWKIQRELARPFKQLGVSPARLGSLFLSQPYYDLVLARKKQITEGGIAATPKLAVYLIFPQSGLLASHEIALTHLVENGYAPIVVSNLPLGDADKLRLRQQATLIIERPNFGYDFGGYRDGLLEAVARFSGTERLVLLNDSAWFPLPGSANWLQEAEAMELDFVGAATNYGHARVNPEDFREIEWSYSSTHRNFHYCSFALMISGALLRDPAFLRFWQKFPLTNNKTVTVRRGEIGLSRWVIENGRSHGTTLQISDLDRELAQLPTGDLRQIAAQTIIPEMARMKKVKAEFDIETATDNELIRFILTSVARQGISYTHPRLVHDRRGFGFLKKSPLWLDEQASDLTLAFTRDLSGEVGAVIHKEAMDLRHQRGARFAPPALVS
ncbi:rhamnan synthesis F family protein [Phaeobacter sp. B1627]|uniref:rhamnan synthesis F family protein n=1 Tax=Phaeobacter sp. B1627 TaxID=2583809 RepID=UPI0011190EAD|nr:rhamnan synthesis F family protein [Phaeobacter sp. B1627]TNJ41025.1 hypothetical protein FGE21_15330 [Phaeobacter sp. B1627]